jgi:hypothetical protein
MNGNIMNNMDFMHATPDTVSVTAPKKPGMPYFLLIECDADLIINGGTEATMKEAAKVAAEGHPGATYRVYKAIAEYTGKTEVRERSLG